jgi:hypothetical protein
MAFRCFCSGAARWCIFGARRVPVRRSAFVVIYLECWASLTAQQGRHVQLMEYRKQKKKKKKKKKKIKKKKKYNKGLRLRCEPRRLLGGRNRRVRLCAAARVRRRRWQVLRGAVDVRGGVGGAVILGFVHDLRVFVSNSTSWAPCAAIASRPNRGWRIAN